MAAKAGSPPDSAGVIGVPEEGGEWPSASVAVVPRRVEAVASVPLDGRLPWLDAICPYLRAADASWRSAFPTRDHRCWAVDPPSTLPTATQQQLCLVDDHGGCERFLHSQEQRAAALAADHIDIARLGAARFGPMVRAIPIAVDPRPALGDTGSTSGTSRRRWSAVLVGGGIILAAAAALAAVVGGNGDRGVAVLPPSLDPLATAGALGVATDRPRATVLTNPRPSDRSPGPQRTSSPTPVPTVRSTPTPTVAASAGPAAHPTPPVRIARRYTVKSGDTIKSIAAKFGLKPRDLRAVNDIGKDVEPGQRLRIPAGPVPTAAAASETPLTR